jgi:hypothetical protein
MDSDQTQIDGFKWTESQNSDSQNRIVVMEMEMHSRDARVQALRFLEVRDSEDQSKGDALRTLAI